MRLIAQAALLLGLAAGCNQLPDSPSNVAGLACPEGMEFVPEGPFVMGNRLGQFDEKLERSITISSFCMDRTEVTNSAYHECVAAGVCHEGPRARDQHLGKASHPVVGIAWRDAESYCGFVAKRLPTEAEWEKAARGVDGRKYPWGNTFITAAANCGQGCGEFHQATAPVGSFPAGRSPYNILDLAGNAAELVADYYAEGYTRYSPDHDPPGPATGVMRVVKGGAYIDVPEVLRAANRYYKRPEEQDPTVGFRCAVSIGEPRLDARISVPVRSSDKQVPLPNADLQARRTVRPESRVRIEFTSAVVGSDEAGPDETPVRTVSVGPLEFDRTEATVASYEACLSDRGCEPGLVIRNSISGWRCNLGRRDRLSHPVNCATHESARQFCEWAGGRLPTEEEWEAAARGGTARRYPWGNRLIPFAANCDDVVCGDGHALTAPAGSFPAGASGHGLLDMAGNVMEWTSTRFESPAAVPDTAPLYVLKGGSWKHLDFFMRASARNYHTGDSPLPEAGFRCVYDVRFQ